MSILVHMVLIPIEILHVLVVELKIVVNTWRLVTTHTLLNVIRTTAFEILSLATDMSIDHPLLLLHICVLHVGYNLLVLLLNVK